MTLDYNTCMVTACMCERLVMLFWRWDVCRAHVVIVS